MDKGYIENGFIVDLTTAKRTSEVIYELSRVLDMPEAKEKHICLKLGSVPLSQAELTSIKALVELMESQLAFISTSSEETLESATALDIKISEFTNEIEAPDFDNSEPAPEVSEALDNIFGEDSSVEASNDVETVRESVDKEISPIVHHNEEIAEKVEALEVKEDKNGEVVAMKNAAESLPTFIFKKNNTFRSKYFI